MFASFVHMMRDALSLFSFTTSANTGSMSSAPSDEEAGRHRSSGHSHGPGGGAGAGASGGGTALSHMQDSARRLFSHRAGGGSNYDQIKAPLMGVEVGFSEAQTLAQEVDNINTQGTVKLLNFAYLSLENKG